MIAPTAHIGTSGMEKVSDLPRSTELILGSPSAGLTYRLSHLLCVLPAQHK